MSKSKAILFYARDHLSREFPKIGVMQSDYDRVYLVSKPSEAVTVKSYDKNGIVFDLSSLIGNVNVADYLEHQKYSEMHELISKDRYLKRMSLYEISKVIAAVIELFELSLIHI